MKKYTSTILACLLALALAGCSSGVKSVSSKAAGAINAGDYFPPPGMSRTYYQYGTTGKTMSATDTVKLSSNPDGQDTLYIHEQGGMAVETVKEYLVEKEKVTLVYEINALKNEETEVTELASKPKWEKHDESNSVSSMTATGLTLEVPAGMFEDVIEVTTVNPEDKKDRRTIHYYAPGIGLIKKVYDFGKDSGFTDSELASVVMPDNPDEEPAAADKDEMPEMDTETSAYTNTEYGFSFDMPADMLESLTVKKGSWDSEALTAVDFVYKEPSRKIKQSLFSILVFPNNGDADTWDHPVYRYLGSNNSYIFAYAMSAEPAEK